MPRFVLLIAFGVATFVACSSGGGGTLIDAGSSSDAAAQDASSGDAAVSFDATSNDAAEADAAPLDASADVAKVDAAKKDTGTGVCVSNCLTDQECQDSCGNMPSNTIACCDIASGTCFAANGTTCP